MISLLRTIFLIGALILVGATAWLAHLRADDTNGTFITFTSTRTGRSQIYLMSGSGAGIRQLSNFTGTHWYTDYTYPRWYNDLNCIRTVKEYPHCVDLWGNTTRLRTNTRTRDEEILSYSLSNANIAHDYTSDFNWIIFNGGIFGLFRSRVDGTGLTRLSTK